MVIAKTRAGAQSRELLREGGEAVVQRRLLTADFVNSVQPPQKGEQWIADTKIRGFGLRLFASGKGGKSFTVRVADELGFVTRKSFNVHQSWRYRAALRDGRYEFQLGEFIDEARSWAQFEIEKLKHLNLTYDEDQKDRDEVGQLVRKMTFMRATESLIKGLSVAGRSETYITSLYSVLKYIPDQVMRKSLEDITPEEMAEALVNNGIDPGTMRKLKALAGQVYKHADDFRAGLWKFHDDLSKHFRLRLEAHYDPYPELRELRREDFDRALKHPEGEHARWQQALCIRLYFELGASLKRLMQAEWRSIYGGHWYPYLPSEKKYWFESREPLNDEATRLVARINKFALRDFGETRFLFPSANRDKDAPIASVDTMWRYALRKCGLNYYPIRHFALRFNRDRNNPSYCISLLDQYREIWRGTENAAELSRVLTARANSRLTSSSYSASALVSQTQVAVNEASKTPEQL